MGIRDAWELSLQREGHVRDPAQESVVDELEALQDALVRSATAGTTLLDRLLKRTPAPVPGIYLWGSVGRGKTFLMDLFFETLLLPQKKRIHFHRMMHDVHARLAEIGDVEDPLDRVAEDIAADVRVLCFDEFFVSDIGDAMILGRLLRGLFDRGITLITTSNAHPDDLYRNGLQRSRFLPAIELLKTHTKVVNMEGSTDYRLRLLEEAGTYLTPADGNATARLEHLFNDSASSALRADADLNINGRTIRARCAAKGIVWFEFSEICDGPRSQADYIEIARWYPSVIVSDVPQFTGRRENQARRFIALVDEFYDRRVKLILSAACPADRLYSGKKLAFEFDRTLSRLTEMQSSDYLASAHLA